MTSREDIQLLAQLVDNLDTASFKLEEAYKENNKEKFEEAKNAILDFQKKISIILRK